MRLYTSISNYNKRILAAIVPHRYISLFSMEFFLHFLLNTQFNIFSADNVAQRKQAQPTSFWK